MRARRLVFLLFAVLSFGSSAHAADDVWVEETIRYDENGNVVETVDAEGRVTTRTYDDRDRLIEESAPLGKTTTYAYDGNDNRISETRQNPGGSGAQTRTITYDDANRPIATTDAEGGTRRQVYDAAGNVIEKVDARGNTTRYTYDARNQVTSQIGPEAGQQIRYTYDQNLNKVAEAWANGRALAYVYDALDRLIRTEDETGLVEVRELDADGLPIAIEDADGRHTTIAYDDLHHPTTKRLPGTVDRTITTTYSIHGDLESQTDPRCHTTTHQYDTLGRRIRTAYPIVDGVTAAQVMTYDKVGNVTSESNARGQVTNYVVNALNQRETQIDPEADGTRYTQHWTYDALGNALTHVDRRGVLSVTAYDKENRIIGRARDGRILETRTLDAEGNATTVADALGRETYLTYDKANRKVREQRPLEAIETWTYTPEGDVAAHTDADGRTTSTTYTNRRYVVSETLAGETTTYTTNGSGQRLTRQRPNGAMWTYAYDDAGRLSTVTDPLDHATTYGYDAADNRTSVTDANDHETTFAYDARNRLSGKMYPGGDASTWKYDADGNRTETRTPLGRFITTTYDALSRAITTMYANPRPNEPSQTTRRYDGNANVTAIEEMVDGNTRTEARRYDWFDRIESVVNPLNRRVAYRYDAVGNRTHLTDHDGNETVWSYDDLNRNSAILVSGQGATRQTHTKAGKLDTLTRPDGSASAYTYDDAGRIASIVHAKAGTPIATYAYRYDLNGNRIEQKETNGGTTNGEAITTYAYDDADRLTEMAEPERTSTYTLDAVGNRTVEHVEAGGTTISHSVLTYNARDQLTSRTDNVANVHVTQTYDANGNLATQTSNGITRTYTYDARDRLIELQEGTAAPLTLDYNAHGLRLEKTHGAATTRYQYDQQSLLAETNAIGNTLTRYHYSANQLISTTKTGTTPTQWHYLLDALRSPIATLTQDGAVNSRTRYDAWGEVIAQQGTSGATITPSRDTAIVNLPITDEQPVGFTGYLKDAESGLYYAKARYYDPAVARFTTEDPEAGKDLEPPSLHRYLYAYANPTTYVDFDGRQACRGYAVEGCPLQQWTMPNRAISQTIANDALPGDPQLAEVDADRALALPSTSLMPDQHINTERYRLVPQVDPDGDGKAVRYYVAQNRETHRFDWTVPPAALDGFVATESERMNLAAYSRTMGGTTPSNIEVQRMLRDGMRGDVPGVLLHFGKSWAEALKDPTFYLNTAGGVTGGSVAKAAGPTRATVVVEESSGGAIAQGNSGLRTNNGFVRFAADYDSHILTRDYTVPSKRGIGGAHNADEFSKHSSEYRILSQVNHPTLDGVSTVTYQMAARDPAGNFTGAYRSAKFEKTIYDPSKISNEEFLTWGRQAAVEAQSHGTLNREWAGTAPNGVKFRGYVDKSGAVTSFFPDF